MSQVNIHLKLSVILSQIWYCSHLVMKGPELCTPTTGYLRLTCDPQEWCCHCLGMQHITQTYSAQQDTDCGGDHTNDGDVMMDED